MLEAPLGPGAELQVATVHMNLTEKIISPLPPKGSSSIGGSATGSARNPVRSRFGTFFLLFWLQAVSLREGCCRVGRKAVKGPMAAGHSGGSSKTERWTVKSQLAKYKSQKCLKIVRAARECPLKRKGAWY